MNITKFIIHGRLDGLNEYTKDNRSSKYTGNKTKKDNEKGIIRWLRVARPEPLINYPITMRTTWYEPEMRRDGDNVVFAKKFILDACVKYGLLKGDSLKYVNKFIDTVKVDREHPRIEIEMYVEEGELK